MVENSLQVLEPDGNHRDAQLCGNHGDAGLEPVDFATFGPFPFRIYKDRESVLQDLADISKGLACSGLALRQWKRVEEHCREVVVQAVGEPRLPAELLRKEVGLEELLGHRGRHTVAPPWRQREEDGGG